MRGPPSLPERSSQGMAAAISITVRDRQTSSARPSVRLAVRQRRLPLLPLLIVVLKKDQSASKNDILEFMRGKTASWWMPDDIVFVDEIPHTATGKIQKATLRERFKDYRFPAA